MKAYKPHIPVIALTANVMPEDKATYIATGFDGVMGKPLELSELNDTLYLHLNA
jgi:CheY-like chemotaxis protein